MGAGGHQGDGEANDFSGVKVQDLMRLYYGNVFPFKEFFSWLAYSNDTQHAQADSSFLQRRELCFTLDGDIFVRYQSFKDVEDFRKGILRRLPAKIDIGPVYSVDPQRRTAFAGSDQSGTQAFVPLERELVFDIDITDYDDVRKCCKGGDICHKCWPFMAIAIEILDAALREDFGFKHILWVFSGRRGIHGWVCDSKARSLPDDARSALARYLSVYKGVEAGKVKVDLGWNGCCHPSVQRAIGSIKDSWHKGILLHQGLLDDQQSWRRILQYFGEEDFVHKLDDRWAGRHADSSERWEELLAEVEKAAKGRGRGQQVQRALNEVYLAFAYPRLDVEVTKKMNHLLKAPFCVHPKTGKVCVPLDMAEVWNFDPEEVPTVQQLLGELGLHAHSTSIQSTVAARWEETSLAPCMRFFTRFLRMMVVDSQKALNQKAKQPGSHTPAW